MAQRSSVERLPETVRHELERKLADNGFGNYDTRSEALMAMVQTELFDALVEIGDMDNLGAVERFNMVAKASKNIAALTSASTNLKEYQAKLQVKIEQTASEVAKVVKKGGLSDETADEIRRKILGIGE